MGRNDGSHGGSKRGQASGRRRSRGTKPQAVDVDQVLWLAEHGSCRPVWRTWTTSYITGEFITREVWIRPDGQECGGHNERRPSVGNVSPTPRTGGLAPIRRPTSARERKAARSAAEAAKAKLKKPGNGRGRNRN